MRIYRGELDERVVVSKMETTVRLRKYCKEVNRYEPFGGIDTGAVS